MVTLKTNDLEAVAPTSFALRVCKGLRLKQTCLQPPTVPREVEVRPRLTKTCRVRHGRAHATTVRLIGHVQAAHFAISQTSFSVILDFFEHRKSQPTLWPVLILQRCPQNRLWLRLEAHWSDVRSVAASSERTQNQSIRRVKNL